MEYSIDKRLLDMQLVKPGQYGELGLSSYGIPGIGGRIKADPEDFEVEEIPAYYPCGEGEHLFLWIEKRQLSSDELVDHLSRCLEISSGEVGLAGKKDKNAVTRQFVSVPRRVQDDLDRLAHPKLKVLSSRVHKNKLSVGHSKGNRFKIKIRDLVDPDPERIARLVERIVEFGFPNFFGRQRFGGKGDTAEIGFRILKGAEKGLSWRWSKKSGKKFALSAAQSHLFNRYLLKRLVEKGGMCLLAGDVVFKTTGGIFRVEDLEVETPRYLAKEIVPAGPIYGKKTYASAGEALALENGILEEAGIERAAFSRFGKLMLGTRRASVCRPEAFSHSLEENCLNLEFVLPAGSYATVLLAEFMKPLENKLKDESIVLDKS
ncbi:MAG: tRNA pseudouridine(13) synthase TruD [Proteobacteria bacterium]|nr:tRNA pseudouridine(13) synthase TruD [Pseudomonadota bacterium]